MRDRFAAIREYYRHVDEVLDRLPKPRSAPALPAEQGGATAPNPCGGCLECCRYSFYLSRHEFEYLEDFLLRSRSRSPVRWITCTQAADDPRRTTLPEPDYRCPLYEEGQGCMVYEARPLACRTMGPMLPSHSRLPSGCVFTEPMVYSSSEELPHWEEYVKLLRSNYPSPAGYFVACSPESTD